MLVDGSNAIAVGRATMVENAQLDEHGLRERAYFIWESEGRPDGRANEHWIKAVAEAQGAAADAAEEPDEEKVLAGRSDANIPALLTKDVKGG
jgi:hypothetical protein